MDLKEKVILGIKKILFRIKLLRIMIDEILNYQFYKEFKKNQKKVKEFHNKHLGGRCFIVATGPSLNKTNLDPIKNEIVFGVNSLCTGLDKFGINCDYYVISDRVSWKRHSKCVLDLDTNLFPCYVAARHYIRDKPKNIKKEPYLIKGDGSILWAKKFPEDISRHVYADGYTVIIVCLQIAYYMGFKEVYLVGCDCDYSNEAHFDGKKAGVLTENRLKEGQHWKRVFSAYRICKQAFEGEGRKIYNSTVGGKLEVFERRNLEEAVKNPKNRKMGK